MLKSFLATAALLMLAACDPKAADVPDTPPAPEVSAGSELQPGTSTPPDTAGPETVPPITPADYIILDIMSLGLTGQESMQEVGELLRAKHGLPDETEGNYSQTLEIIEDGANVTVVFTVDGLPDDAVKAEQYVVEAYLPSGNWTPVNGYGLRQKCLRGASPDIWTNDPCI